MKRFLSKLLLSALVSIFAAGVFLVQNLSKIPFLADEFMVMPPPVNPVQQITELKNQERYAEASAQVKFFRRFDHLKNDPQLLALQKEIDGKRSEWGYQLGKFGQGLFKGQSDEAIGQSSALVSDFLVIGDLRDLAKEGWKAWNDEEVDKIVVALSSLGLVATGSQVASLVGTAGTGGAAAPAVAGSTAVKSGITMLKTAKKLGKLPSWLWKTVEKNYKNPQKLAQIMGDIGPLSKQAGGLHLLAAAKNEEHLRQLGKFAQRFGDDAALMHQLYGDKILAAAARANNGHSLKVAMAHGDEGVRLLKDMGERRFIDLARKEAKAAKAAKGGAKAGSKFTAKLAKFAKKVLSWFNDLWTALLAALANVFIWLKPAKKKRPVKMPLGRRYA